MDSITCLSGNGRGRADFWLGYASIGDLPGISRASPMTAAQFFSRSWSAWHLRVFDPSVWSRTAATTYISFAQVGSEGAMQGMGVCPCWHAGAS